MNILSDHGKVCIYDFCHFSSKDSIISTFEAFLDPEDLRKKLYCQGLCSNLRQIITFNYWFTWVTQYEADDICVRLFTYCC